MFELNSLMLLILDSINLLLKSVLEKLLFFIDDAENPD